jgi:hypothetical protein
MIHQGMSYETYASLLAFRAGMFKKLLISPQALAYDLAHPTPASEAMKLGSAVDDSITDPRSWPKKYAVAPTCDRRTKVGKEEWEKFSKKNAGKTILTFDQYMIASGMVEALEASKTAGALITRADKQIVMTWVDKDTGLDCKSRPDGLICDTKGGPTTGSNIIYDIKTTSDYCKNFRYQLKKLGYHHQAAHYVAGALANGIVIKDFVFIVVESFAPHGVQCFRLMDDVLELGRAKNAELLKLYKQCKEADSWPSYPDQIVDCSLSDWEKASLLAE